LNKKASGIAGRRTRGVGSAQHRKPELELEMKRLSGRKRAFTLIELLVVVAIIALLIAILLPSLGKAQQQAKLAACKSNIKMIMIGAQAYWQEWNSFVGFAPGIDRKMLLYPYINQGKNNADVDGRQVWHCPSNDKPLTQCGYGFNTALNWKSTSAVANWQMTVALVDAGLSDNGTVIADTLTTMASPPDKKGTPASLSYRPNARHSEKRVNIGFADGHVDDSTIKEPFYPGDPGVWFGNAIVDPLDPNYKDQLWDVLP
jgi:prepilin-type N-terminal cleavage/methylation domain-containing protein/prepilin-type processing-associated H-X9-DG protein